MNSKLQFGYILTSAVLLTYGAVEFMLTPSKISAFTPLLIVVIATILLGRAFVYVAEVSRKLNNGKFNNLNPCLPQKKKH